MFPNCPEIKSSTNYDIFKKIDWNRSVDPKNVQKLVTENRDNFQLHKFPILVSNDFKIIDGQHRYEVAKEIGSPVYYIMEGHDTSFKAVHSVNKAGKKHTLKDKLEMLYRAGDEGAAFVYKAFNLYAGKFDLTVVAQTLSSGKDSGENKKEVDDLGAIVLKYKDAGLEVLDSLYNSNIPGRHKRKIVYALLIISRRTGTHPVAIVKRVEANLIKWIEPRSVQEAQRMILLCYNLGLQAKNKLVLEGK